MAVSPTGQIRPLCPGRGRSETQPSQSLDTEQMTAGLLTSNSFVRLVVIRPTHAKMVEYATIQIRATVQFSMQDIYASTLLDAVIRMAFASLDLAMT